MLAELEALGASTLDEVITAFVQYRLLTVDRDPCSTSDRDLGFEEQLPRSSHGLGPHDGTLTAVAHEGVGGRATKRRKRGQVTDSFEQARLPFSVAAHHDGQARGQRRLGGRVVPEIGQPNAANERTA